MKVPRSTVCSIALAVSSGASLVATPSCSGTEPVRPGGPSVAVSVAPLALPGVRNACYTVTVTNQLGLPVWTAQHLCADQYGDAGGGLAYVGPCDADATGLPPGDLVNDNTVTLVLEDLFATDGASPGNAIPHGDYTNPCGVVGTNWDGFGPCTRTAPCLENADAAVVFDLTIMRRAHQGFFDVAVNFDDVFCSAKLDCIGDPPGFVFDPGTMRRTASFVLGFACTSGTSAGGRAQPTWLYLSDVVLTCGGLTPMRLDLAAVTDDGNQGPVGPGVVQWMQFTGHETVGGDAFDKCYWNVAGGLDLAALTGRTCTLTATGAAASTLWPGDTPPADEVRPVITWNVPVLTAGALCDAHPLDGDSSGVRTGYLGDATTRPAPTVAPFVRHRRCGTAVSCGDATFAPTTLAGGAAAVAVRIGNAEGTFTLPADDTFTVEGCCESDCCGD